MIKRILHIILLCLILSGFITIIYQEYFPLVQQEPLKGYSPPFEKVNFSWNTWWSGEFQEKKEVELANDFGFRNDLIRLEHQLVWTVFRSARTAEVLVGKEDYLFEETYIKAYSGKDYIGDERMLERMEKIKLVSDTLKKLGKDLILVFAPGKATFYSDYLPENLVLKKTKTNYAEHIKYAEDWGLNYVDFQSWFLENKNSSVYPLYPKYGIHWSYYGAALAQDSLVRYIEKLRNIDMANMKIVDYEVGQSQKIDFDIGSALNLIEELNDDTTAVPKIIWEEDTGKDRPTMVTIADSFYWLFIEQTFTHPFGKNQFWYYYHDIYPATSRGFTKHSDLILSEEIANHDIFIILGTDANLSKFGWDFIEESYELFYK